MGVAIEHVGYPFDDAFYLGNGESIACEERDH